MLQRRQRELALLVLLRAPHQSQMALAQAAQPQAQRRQHPAAAPQMPVLHQTQARRCWALLLLLTMLQLPAHQIQIHQRRRQPNRQMHQSLLPACCWVARPVLLLHQRRTQVLSSPAPCWRWRRWRWRRRLAFLQQQLAHQS